MQHLHILSLSLRAWLVALCCLPLPLPLTAAPADVSADQWLCAPGCWCSRDGLSAQCSGVTPELAALPSGLVQLTLRAHQLRGVRNATFATLSELQQLDLSDGRIAEVTADSFSALPHLRSLSLSNNELTFLPADVFKPNAALEALSLSGNPLVLPSIGPFLRSHSLRELNLAYCSLRRLTPDTFTQLPSLLTLDLSSNSFSQLTAEAVEPFINLSWLRVGADALSEDALAFLQVKGVDVEVGDALGNMTAFDYQDDDGPGIYAGLLDSEYDYDEDAIAEGSEVQLNASDAAFDADQFQLGNDQLQTETNAGLVDEEYHYEEYVIRETYEVVINTSDVVYDMDSQSQSFDDQLDTGVWETARHPPWRLVVYSVVLASTMCVAAVLTYWAIVLATRRRSAARVSQGPRDTLDRAFRQVASLPAYQQLQSAPAKGGSRGYRRLYDEEDAPGSLPPRADLPERCSCLSCSEPVPTQPCIRFYERPASVHGAVPSRYYSLYPSHNL